MNGLTKGLLFAGGGLALAGLGAALAKGGSGGGSGARNVTNYPINSNQPYGPKWKKQRPYGLPTTARKTSTRDYGLAFLEERLNAYGVQGILRRALVQMAKKESGGYLGRPANIFDTRIKDPGDDGPPNYYGTAVDGRRTPGKQIITAWGFWGFNRGAWRSLPGVKPHEFPWDSSPIEEVDRPLKRYIQLWDEAIGRGADEIHAARYVHLWQRGVAFSNRYRNNAANMGWASAWRQVPADHRNRVDQHLHTAGII